LVRSAFILIVVSTIATALGGCSSGDGAPDRIVGVITEVRLDSEGNAEFIKVRDRDDHIWNLAVEYDPDIPAVPGFHLEEHRAGRIPVVVHLRESANGPYASRIDDLQVHE
jgi:hypothetical protein